MNNIVKIIIGVLLTIAVGYGAIMFLDYNSKQQLVDEQALIEYEREQYQQNKELMAQIEEARAEENARLASLNAFEKIAEARDIRMLFIMNSDYLENGEIGGSLTWPDSLRMEISSRYGNDARVDYFPTSWNNSPWIWSQYTRFASDTFFDIVFLNIGENDIDVIEPDEFAIFYEALLSSIFTFNNRAYVIPVINPNVIDDRYAESIVELSNYYGLEYIDLREYVDLQLDEVQVAAVNNVLELFDKKIAEPDYGYIVAEEPLYKETRSLMSIQYDVQPFAAEGFWKENSRVLSDEEGSYLMYASDRKYMLLTYVAQPYGGEFDLYINDELHSTIDTSHSFTAGRTLLFENDTRELMSMRIVVKSIEDDEVVMLHSFSTN